jgi:iron(III) transport system ATP-binding protein
MSIDLMLACRDLGKSFGPVRALEGVNLSAQRGAILAILGPSGCGKTTLLRLLAGLERPDEGSIDIGGRRVDGGGVHLPPERRRVGMVFQHYALFPHLNAAENVAFGLPGGKVADRRVQAMLGLVGLGALGHRMPHELSGGQQQRVALARALAPQPELLLLDEPFSNLDARMRVTVREEVREIIRATGTTALFVTHDQEEALFIGDEVAVLNGGRLEQLAAPAELYHRPRTRFVAEFLGQTGFLPARVIEGGLNTELGPLAQPVDLPPGEEVDLLVRPDDLSLVEDSLGPARVYRRVFQGMHMLYRVRLPSGRKLDVLAPHTLFIEEGAPVRVVLPAKAP